MAGGYSAEFLDALSGSGPVHAFVNVTYCYRHRSRDITIHRVFFPITDHFLQKKGLLRNVVRCSELAWGYFVVLMCAVVYRPHLAIYNPITNLWATSIFFKLLQKVCRQCWVSIHDAQSHRGEVERHRDLVYLRADGMIFHNVHSRAIAFSRLKMAKPNVVIPYPWSLEKLPFNPRKRRRAFLFIGHVRPSKGIDCLLESFARYREAGGDWELMIEGAMTLKEERRMRHFTKAVMNKALSDVEFMEVVSEASFVVLPYRKGYSNSSVHLCSIIHGHTPFICSDIELFADFVDGSDCLKFAADDTGALCELLFSAQKMTEAERGSLADHALAALKTRGLQFSEKMLDFVGQVHARGD